MKKYIFTIFVFILVLFCILFPEAMITSTKTGITLWWKIVLPSLFPFMILSNLITKTAIPKLFGKLLNPIMKFIFRLPGISAIAIFLGMIGGYPIGAKVTSDLRTNNTISKDVANTLIKFTNNSGPLFITGAIGIGLYNNPKIGSLLLITHYLSALVVGLLFRKKEEDLSLAKEIDFEVITLSNFGQTLNTSIKNAIISVSSICGFIVLFSIISTILFQTGIISTISAFIFPTLNKKVSHAIISGLLEVTNGINLLSATTLPLKQKLILTATLIGFGGFSIHAQTLGILSKTDIKISSYLAGKTLQGIIAGTLTYIFLIYTNFSEILLTPVFSEIQYNSHGFNMIFSVITGFFIFIVVFKIFQILVYKSK